jgi:hypothetical protein
METMQHPTLVTNLYGQHGPRCPVCSGLGRVLPMVAGMTTRSTQRCQCKGTGIDLEAVRQSRELALIAEVATLNQQLAASMTSHRQFADRLATLERLAAKWTPPQGMNSRQYWSELIAWATADGTAVANTVSETIAFPNVTLPGGYMQDGRLLVIELAGRLSTTGTPTMQWGVRWGGVAGTLLAQTEAITMGSGVTAVNWTMRVKLQTRSNGSTGTLFAMGRVDVHTAIGTIASNVFGVSGFDLSAAVTADLTADTPLSVTAKWGTASASNTLTGHMYDIRSEN